ncbi:PspA-associated protein PspAB [Halorientalis halophila]|uniref:PspA-associated protein PspAB n=1 Tax=Halorientalis halophila TaxID=3108499 RepID=UPI00300957F7
MGLLDGLRQALGLGAETAATRPADPEDLFGMSTAYVTMAADLGFESVGCAALCFSSVDSTDFADAVDEVAAILEAGEAETGTVAEFQGDTHGYDWIVLEDDDVEDLLTSLHFAADTLVERGFGSRLLAALFPFRKAAGDALSGDAPDRPIYWVYSFRRGAYYPFAPTGGHERDDAVEFKLASVLDGELDVEDDEGYWYPLWPEGRGHPWD